MIAVLLGSVLAFQSGFDSYRAHIAAADAAMLEGDSRRAKEWLESAPKEFRGWEWDYLRGLTDQSVGSWKASEEGLSKLAMSPRGEVFASAGTDGVVRLWSTRDNRLVRELKGHSAAVFGLNFNADGSKLVTTSRDNSIRIWDVESGESVVLGEHPVTPYNAAFTPDGMRVVSVGWRMHPENKHPVGLIRVWDVAGRKMISDQDYTTHPISSVTFSKDGSKAYIGCWEYQVVELDMVNFALGREFAPPDDPGYSAVDAVSLTEDESLLITATKDKAAKVFDLKSGAYIGRMDHAGYVTAMARVGGQLITASQDQSLRVFDIGSRKEVVRLQGHGLPVTSLAVTPDGSKAFSGDGSGQIKMWDLRDAGAYKPEVVFDGAWSCVIGPDGKRMAVGTNAKFIEIVDMESRKVVQKLGPFGALVVDTAWSPDGTRVAGGSNDGSFRVFEADSGREVWKFQGRQQVRSAAWSRDGKFVAAGESGKGYVWDAATGETIYEGDLGEYTINAAFSPDSKSVFFGAGKRIVQVDPALKKTVREFEPAMTDIFDIAVAPNGEWLVVGETAGQVQRFEISSGKLAWTRALAASQWGVAISPDGKRVATTGYDFAMRLIDSESGAEVFSIRNLSIQGFDVCYSPDGSSIAYMGGGGLVWWINKGNK